METTFEIFKTFITNNTGADISYLRLKYAGKEPTFHGLSAIDQIEARKKTRTKLSSFIAHDAFLFPSTLSAEQSSNESVARFHASLFSSDEKVADLTAGLGIDAFTIAKHVNHVTAIERYNNYSDTLIHNAKVIDVENITVINANSLEWLDTHDISFNTIFVDPARRGDMNKRTFALEDCEPDIIANLNLLAAHTDRILVKCSPMLDVKELIRRVPSLRRIFIVSYASECKEILIEIIPDNVSAVEIISVSLGKHGDSIILPFSESDLSLNPSTYADIDSILKNNTPCYLYEPDPAIMKISPWTALVKAYPSLVKIAPNTNLFITSDPSIPLPGRIVSILSPLDKKSLKQLRGTPINVVARNFPLSAPQIISKYNLIAKKQQKQTLDAEARFLYCFRDSASHPHLLLTAELDNRDI